MMMMILKNNHNDNNNNNNNNNNNDDNNTVVISTKVAYRVAYRVATLWNFANDLFARFNDYCTFLMGVATQVIPPFTPHIPP